ncbi:hypothetical protein WK25_22825 [Burkholderia latens]|nr:hypothetical protein WK25_22825 [Burkholderia latens]
MSIERASAHARRLREQSYPLAPIAYPSAARSVGAIDSRGPSTPFPKRIASHRIASHRIASHRIASHSDDSCTHNHFGERPSVAWTASPLDQPVAV